MPRNQPFHLDPLFRRIVGRLADQPDFDPLGQIAVLESGAFVAPGLTDLGRPLLALHVDLQDAVGIAEANGRDDAGQIDVAAGRPRPAVMGQRLDCRGRESQGEDRYVQEPHHGAPIPVRGNHTRGRWMAVRSSETNDLLQPMAHPCHRGPSSFPNPRMDRSDWGRVRHEGCEARSRECGRQVPLRYRHRPGFRAAPSLPPARGPSRPTTRRCGCGAP